MGLLISLKNYTNFQQVYTQNNDEKKKTQQHKQVAGTFLARSAHIKL